MGSAAAKPLYRRVLLKLSGESLVEDESDVGIAPDVLIRIAEEIRQVAALGVQLGLVLGAGNFIRGSTLSKVGIERVTADHMGMLATVINALAMRDALERVGVPALVMSAIPMMGMTQTYERLNAINYLEQDRVVLFAAGTGNPLVTTDSAASLRGIEVAAEVLLKATKVDGIYSADPKLNPEAKRYTRISYQDALDKELGVMDLSAFCQCRDYGLPIRVFNICKPGTLLRVVTNSEEGTWVA